MGVLCIGSMNLDYVYRVPHLVLPGETLTASAMTTNPGGKGLNQSLALAKAGAAVRHAGCVGAAGIVLRELLSEYGVDVSLVQMVDEPQGSAVIQVDDETGQNSIVIFGGSNRALTESRVAELLGAAYDDDIVVLQNEISSMKSILAGCAEHGLPVVLNPAPYSDDIAEMDLSAVAWIIVNEIEVAQLTGTDDPDAAWAIVRSRWPRTSLVVTLGEQGCICFSGDERFVQPAFAVDAIDTTAAGDTFIGYFVAGLQEDLPLPCCLERASLASAIAVTRPGAAPSIPEKAEVDADGRLTR